MSGKAIPLCAWTHIAYVIEGKTASLYLNGTLDSSRPTVGTPLYNNGTLSIGQEGSFAGPRSLLRRFQYRPHPISAAEVAEEYAGLGYGPAPPLANGL